MQQSRSNSGHSSDAVNTGHGGGPGVGNAEWKLPGTTPPPAFNRSVAHNLQLDNHRITAPEQKIHLDIIPLVIGITLNPFWFNVKFERAGDRYEIHAFCKKDRIGWAGIYKDPQRGGTYFRPDVDPDYRRKGLGSLLYLLAGRILYVEENTLICSNPHSLTPNAQRVWTKFTAQGWARKLAENSFQISETTVNSRALQGLLHFATKTEIQREMIERSPLYKIKK